MEETTIPHVVVDAEADPETKSCASFRLLAELSDAERMAPRLRRTTAVLRPQLACPLGVDNEQMY
jgi:hypothetical protein